MLIACSAKAMQPIVFLDVICTSNPIHKIEMTMGNNTMKNRSLMRYPPRPMHARGVIKPSTPTLKMESRLLRKALTNGGNVILYTPSILLTSM